MKNVQLFQIYRLGAQMQPLAELVNTEQKAADAFITIINAKHALKQIIELNTIDVDFSKSSCLDLMHKIDTIITTYYDQNGSDCVFKEENRNTTFDFIHYYNLKQSYQTFEPVFKTELERIYSYIVPRKGIYDTNRLIEDPMAAFNEDIRNKIRPLTSDEFMAACRCFAFGLYTACGFHACRAIESQILELCKFYKIKKSQNDTWGQMISKLEQSKEKKKATQKILDQLKLLKDYDRNPISHLDLTLDITKSNILLERARIAITEMIIEMGK